ncbi:hypothetical protein BGZ83_008369 [Gryganskiella cystojenkinii]|nr:hypothetical protein BGZ83_008369 [Gryganskiella cystojenkinii]
MTSTTTTSSSDPPSARLHVQANDEFLRDSSGRAWLLRGVNLSGSCKFPRYPQPVPSHVRGGAFLKPRPNPLISPTQIGTTPEGNAIRIGGVTHGGESAVSNDIDEKKGDVNGHGRVNDTNGGAATATGPETPTPQGGDSLMEDGEISFVGRPFELDDADEHLSRLRHWGFRMIRWVVTWEAVEHRGPGKYDEEFLDYTVKALLKAKEYGFKVMIDFHQDVWSRFSGGSGAPLWTFYAAGLDPHNFAQTGAAVVHNALPETEPMLRMVWLTNYYKLACASLFSLFFSGRLLAPQCTFQNGVNIQDYLQNHFLGSIEALVQKIHTTPGLEDEVVIGYDSWNEPSCGWIGLERLDVLPDEHDFRQGDMPTPFQSMQMGESQCVTNVDVYRLKLIGPVKVGSRTIDPAFNRTNGSKVSSTTSSLQSDLRRRKVKAWLDQEHRQRYDRHYGIERDSDFPKAGTCLWAQHGVWDVIDRKILQQDYFARGPYKIGGDVSEKPEKIRWVEDHWLPFAEKVIRVVRKTHPSAILFLEPPVYVPPPNLARQKEDDSVTKSAATSLTENMVYTPHHYDDVVLLTKKYLWWVNLDILGLSRGRHKSLVGSVVFGKRATEALFGNQIGSIQKECHERLGKRPVLIGETGLHFDVGLDDSQQAGSVQVPQHQKESSTSSSLFPWVSSTSGAKTTQGPGTTTKQFQQAFDNILNGLDRTRAHYTLWNYTIENDRQYGDGWNGENLSLYCKEDGEQRTGHLGGSIKGPRRWCLLPQELDRGGRAIEQFCRPYPVATVGTPVKIEFDRHQIVFKLWTTSVPSDGALTNDAAETEIYVPWYHFGGPDSCEIMVSDGSFRWSGLGYGKASENECAQLLNWKYGKEKEHWIEIHRTK